MPRRVRDVIGFVMAPRAVAGRAMKPTANAPLRFLPWVRFFPISAEYGALQAGLQLYLAGVGHEGCRRVVV